MDSRIECEVIDLFNDSVIVAVDGDRRQRLSIPRRLVPDNLRIGQWLLCLNMQTDSQHVVAMESAELIEELQPD